MCFLVALLKGSRALITIGKVYSQYREELFLVSGLLLVGGVVCAFFSGNDPLGKAAKILGSITLGIMLWILA